MNVTDRAPVWMQVLVVFAMLLLIAGMNSTLNIWKQHDCESEGGRFIENISDSNQSTCIH